MSHHRHMPFFVGLLAGAVALAISLALASESAIQIGAVVFFLVYLTITGLRFRRMSASYLKTHATEDDEPMPIIFLVTLGTIIVSLTSLFLVLNAHEGGTVLRYTLAFASVALGWLTIHVMAALHYARLYWRPGDGKAHRAGLDFPGTARPEIFDFLYFSLVIGMTAQTADVNTTDIAMRKVVSLHGVVSFFFNTVLVAAAVNAAVSLAG